MFTILDFINLMKYFKGETVESLDANLIITAEDSKAKATTLFNESIDLVCHTTDDYKRLKNFLINWYASLRTFPAVMKNTTDIRSLPEEYLNELIRSFGYTNSLTEMIKTNKIDFFYDLVNLYKIKGTPEAIERVLSYFGIPEVELVEYWLKYDDSGNLVFHPVRISEAIISTVAHNIPFDAIATDPHWMLTADQVNQLFLTNKIAFPSKSPYFGLRPVSEIIGGHITPTLAILTRMVLDEYQGYIGGVDPVKNIGLTQLQCISSLMDLYLASIYAFNSLYNKTIDSTDLSTIIYNGSMSLSNTEIITLYDTLTEREYCNTRDELETNKNLFNLNFTKLRSENFLTLFTTAGTVLSSSNPDLKNIIDTYNLSNNGEEVLNLLLKDLTSWCREHISEGIVNLSSLVLGFGALGYLTDAINFFKPYRARLMSFENIFRIKSPLNDALIAKDVLSTTFLETIVDFDTADSEPGYDPDWNPEGYGILSTPPDDLCRRITDVFVDSTGIVRCNYIDSTAWTGISSIVYSEPNIGDYRVTNMYLEDLGGGAKKLYVDYSDTPETVGGVKTRVVSLAPTGFYTILDIYMNALFQFTIVYDADPVEWPIDSTARIYYSRITYDCGSFFDLGASCDNPPTEEEPYIYVIETIPEIYNYHSDYEDSSSSIFIEWDTDPDSGEIVKIRTDGGWDEMDTGLLFDSPVINDVCSISIIELRYWVTGGDGLFSSPSNWSESSGGGSGASFPNTEYYRAIFDGNSNAGDSTSQVIVDIEILCAIIMDNDYISFEIVEGGKFELSDDFSICALDVQENGIFSTNGYTLDVNTLLKFEDYSDVNINNSIVKVGLNLLPGYTNSEYYTGEFSELSNSGCNLEIYAPSVIYSYNSSVYDKVTFILDDNTITCFGSMFKNTFEVIGHGTIIGP